jgi:hypothetical protein
MIATANNCVNYRGDVMILRLFGARTVFSALRAQRFVQRLVDVWQRLNESVRALARV